MKLVTLSAALLSLYTVGYIPAVVLPRLQVQESHYAQEFSGSAWPDRARRAKSILPVKHDGTFNGFDLYKVDGTPKTFIHCVGENFQEDRDYMFRSCRFETFCFDTKLNDFVVYPENPLNASIYSEVWSSTHNSKEFTTMVAGAQGMNWWPVFWNDRDGKKTRVGKYRPRFVYPGNNDEVPTSYYRFNATWLPFFRHARSPYNPGHLVWDDFLGLYTLLDMFDQADENLLLTHMIRKATGDFDGDGTLPDFDLITKFLPLMGRHDYGLHTLEGNYTLKLQAQVSSSKERHVICADSALIGSGVLNDHGDHHWHGHLASDFEDPHNIGRGGLFRRFRQWMMDHVGIDPNTPIQRDPYLILVSQASSTKRNRRDIMFKAQIATLEKKSASRAIIKSVQLNKLSLTQQIELLSRTAVFISTVGGGTVSATFLPKGASVILYHWKERPLDWDFWNNFPQIKANWFPMEDKDDDFHLDALAETVASQLDYLDGH